MFIDASALTTMVTDEDDARRLWRACSIARPADLAAGLGEGGDCHRPRARPADRRGSRSGRELSSR